MTAWLDSLKSQLEPSLVCRCKARNSLAIRIIHIIDSNGHAICDQCGRAGSVQEFQERRD